MAKTLDSLGLAIPINWVLLFLATLSFTVANVIYSVFCPSIVKDHIGFSGFIGDLKINDHLEEYAIDIKYNGYTKPLTNERECLRINFWEIHKKAKTLRPIPLYICFTIYVIGALFLYSVILKNIFWLILHSLIPT